MTAADLDAARRILMRAAVNRNAADAGAGWVMPADPGAWVAEMSAAVPPAERPTDLGLAALGRWLWGLRLPADAVYVKALRAAWIRDELAQEDRRAGD